MCLNRRDSLDILFTQATFNPPSDALVALAAEAHIDPICNREAAQCRPCWALSAPVKGNLSGRIGVVALEPGQPSCFLFAFEGKGGDAVWARENAIAKVALTNFQRKIDWKQLQYFRKC